MLVKAEETARGLLEVEARDYDLQAVLQFIRQGVRFSVREFQ